MILLDANLLIYAVNQDAPLHRKAKPWLEAALSGRGRVGSTWNVLLAFLRLTTRTGLFQEATMSRAASTFSGRTGRSNSRRIGRWRGPGCAIVAEV
jgi:predicted nucleic acid-binding protein